MSIDPRLVERRRTVAEENAKRSVSRLLRFLLAVVAAGSLVWLAFSPFLSIHLVRVEGVVTSDANAVLADHGVVAGTPMITIRPSAVERELLTDPWIAEARVIRRWPDTVVVEVAERRPVAWVRSEDGWARRALDGVALPHEGEPDPAMGWVEMSDVPDDEVTTSVELLGAIEFVAALPPSLQAGAVVTRIDEEIWATVAGHQVRLGRAVDMEDKARSLAALLDQERLAAGSTVVLLSPTTPSVLPPGADDRAASGTEDDTKGD